MRLENQSGTLRLLVTTVHAQNVSSRRPIITMYPRGHVPKLEVLAALERKLELSLAGNAFQSQDDLLCRLSLLVEHRLGLTTVTGLLAVVTSLSLREQRGLNFRFKDQHEF